MAADPIPQPNPLDPPVRLVLREVRVGLGVPNTITFPGDPAGDDTNRWFQTGLHPIHHTNNEVKYLIDGPDTFRDMLPSLRTANQQGHFIYLLNWWVDDQFSLTGSSGGVTLLSILTEANAHNVMIRAMFWNQKNPPLFNQNTREVDDITALTHGAAILDNRTAFAGSHHQKVLCIMGDQGLITYCGGIDFNPDRVFDKSQLQPTGASIGSSGGKGAPLHDVHCRIRGPASMDILQTFIQRWNDHPEGQEFNQSKGALITLQQAVPSRGPQTVQIGRTFGRISSPGYSFARNGETTGRDMILNAINNARRFIYTECQYFVGNPDVEAALIHALTKQQIEHLTILLTHYRISDLPMVQHHRRIFLGRLRQADAGRGRLRVFTLQPPGHSDQDFNDGKVPHTYIHAKIWIMDDEFAVIGSLNTNHRSWSHDSEIAAGIYDASNEHILTYRLAHWLRIKLWQEHMGMMDLDGEAELADGVASGALWQAPPATARFRPYIIDDTGESPTIPLPDLIFDTIADPA
jgi:phosphatidylserine/phosphatidylglycerophosphate/cardiolipin synthase-like enzyme